jgi:hypothetical protein
MTHHHHDHHSSSSDMTFNERMTTLLNHWIKHNEEHARTYLDWAAKAKSQNLDEIAPLLAEAADMTHAISHKFEAAINIIQDK